MEVVALVDGGALWKTPIRAFLMLKGWPRCFMLGDELLGVGAPGAMLCTTCTGTKGFSVDDDVDGVR